jgi:uncharacterized protein (DUF2141 family)
MGSLRTPRSVERVMPLVVLACLLLGCGTSSSNAPPPKAATHPPADAANGNDNDNDTGQVIIDVSGVRGERGQIVAAIYLGASGFPEDPKAVHTDRTVPITGRQQRLVFDRVPAGPFAVAVYHDEDADGEMDKGMFGMPAEGYGFSRDAAAQFGPPSFESARLTLAGGQQLPVPIRMRY